MPRRPAPRPKEADASDCAVRTTHGPVVHTRRAATVKTSPLWVFGGEPQKSILLPCTETGPIARSVQQEPPSTNPTQTSPPSSTGPSSARPPPLLSPPASTQTRRRPGRFRPPRDHHPPIHDNFAPQAPPLAPAIDYAATNRSEPPIPENALSSSEFAPTLAQIKRIAREHLLSFRIAIGQTLLDDLFAGDAAAYASRDTTKAVRFRAFIDAHGDQLSEHGLSESLLRRCITAHIVARDLPAGLLPQLAMAQVQELYRLDDPAQRRLIAQRECGKAT
jgi:hypothetical protein